MKKVEDHISEHTFDKNGDVDHINGLPMLCEALGIRHISYGECPEEKWDEVMEWSNHQSHEYFAFICQEAGIQPNDNAVLTQEIAMQLELAKHAQ